MPSKQKHFELKGLKIDSLDCKDAKVNAIKENGDALVVGSMYQHPGNNIKFLKIHLLQFVTQNESKTKAHCFR